MKYILRQFFTEGKGGELIVFNQPVFSLETSSTIFYQRLSLFPLSSLCLIWLPSSPLPSLPPFLLPPSPSSPSPPSHSPLPPPPPLFHLSPRFSLPSPPVKPTLRLEIRRKRYTPPASSDPPPPPLKPRLAPRSLHPHHSFRISGTNIHLLGGKE